MPKKCARKSGNCAAAPSYRRQALLSALLAILALPVAPAAAAEPLRVAVLPFQLLHPAPAWDAYGLGMADALATGLANTPPFVLSQPQRLQHVLKGLKPGAIDADRAQRLGKDLGVQSIASGTVEVDAMGLHVSARFFDLPARHSTSSGVLTGELDDVFELETRLATKWLDSLGVVLTREQSERLAKTLKATVNRRAFEFYMQGRVAQRKATLAGWTEAVNYYKKAIAEDDQYALAYARLAESLALAAQARVHRGEAQDDVYNQALQYGHKAVELAPDLLEARRSLGMVDLMMGKLDLAAAELRRALQVHYNDPETWYLLWKTLDSGTPDSANVQEALLLDPSFIPALRDIGIIYYARQQYDLAAQYFQKILAIAPEDAAAHYNLGLALRRKNLLSKAQSEYQQALHYAPDFADASYALGALYLQEGQMDEAIGAFKAAVSANPRHANALFYLGGLYLKKGQYEASLSALRKAEELSPEDPELPLNEGNVYLEMGKLQQALESYQRAADLDPKNPAPHYNQGLVLTKLGRNQEAIEAYEQYLQYAPKAADVPKVREQIRKLKELH